ncbi:MAG: hypothetical protein ACYC1C_01740 [Chloroflexota bacterium]
MIPHADSLPCPDFGLLGPLKRSPEYAVLRKRVADPKPLDAFLVNAEDHYFVFALKPGEGTAEQAPCAMFKMRYDQDGPVIALVITPRGADKVEAVDIRRPDTITIVDLNSD